LEYLDCSLQGVRKGGKRWSRY